MTEVNSELLNFLQRNANQNIEVTGLTTFVANPQSPQIWNICEDKLEEFWKLYCALVHQGKSDLLLFEQRGQFNKLIIELGEIHVGDDELIRKESYKCQEILKESLEIGSSDIHLLIIVLECQISSEKKLVKLMFPYITLSDISANIIQQKLNNYKLNGDNYLPLYGSATSEGHRYELKHIWYNLNTDHIPKEIPLEDVFVPINHQQIQMNLIKQTLFESNEIKYWLPMFLSNKYWPIVTKRKS